MKKIVLALASMTIVSTAHADLGGPALNCYYNARIAARGLAKAAEHIVMGLKLGRLEESNGDYYLFEVPSQKGSYQIRVEMENSECFPKLVTWTEGLSPR